MIAPLERNVRRASLAAVDVATALAMVVAWLSPAVFGADGLRAMVLLAFFVGPDVLFLSTLGRHDASRTEVMGWLLVLVLLGGGLAAHYQTWTPLLAVARGVLVAVLVRPQDAVDEARGGLRAKLVILLLIGAAVVTLLPVPPLGVTPDHVEAMGRPVGEVFFDAPQVALAFGALFFLGSAAIEWWVGGLPDAEVSRRSGRLWMLR